MYYIIKISVIIPTVEVVIGVFQKEKKVIKMVECSVMVARMSKQYLNDLRNQIERTSCAPERYKKTRFKKMAKCTEKFHY